MTITKARAIREHFNEAYEHAKGRYSTVTARQVYYSLREILNRTYGLDLDEGKGYYGHFIRERLTEKFKEDPALQDTILSEDGGAFRHPFLEMDTPIGTVEVREHVGETYSNKIYQVTRTVYDLEPALLCRQVLFVDKRGFSTAFEESGVLERLNLGLVSVQGHGSVVAKHLMRRFNECGIAVYVLHDCDIFGYNIYRQIVNESGTYNEPLDVTDIGLTIGDAERLGKRPERIASQKDHSKVTAQWPEDVRAFFMPDPNVKAYRRVDLYALTNDELIAHIEARIPPRPFTPSDDVIRGCVTIDKEAALKDALVGVIRFFGLSDALAECMRDVDVTDIPEIVRDYVAANRGKHWMRGLSNCIDFYRDEYVKECAYRIFMMLQDAGYRRHQDADG